MASTDSVPKAMEALNISKTKELKGAGPTSFTVFKWPL
jgi:leucyl-tRNA synthetase